MHWTRQNGTCVSFCSLFLGGLLFFDLAIPIFSYIGPSHIFLLPICIPTPSPLLTLVHYPLRFSVHSCSLFFSLSFSKTKFGVRVFAVRFNPWFTVRCLDSNMIVCSTSLFDIGQSKSEVSFANGEEAAPLCLCLFSLHHNTTRAIGIVLASALGLPTGIL